MGGKGSGPPKNHKNIGFLSNIGPDPLKYHKATKTTFNVGPSSALQRNAILMAFRWHAADGPLIVVFGSSLPHQLFKNVKVGPSPPPLMTKLTGSEHSAPHGDFGCPLMIFANTLNPSCLTRYRLISTQRERLF